MNRYSFFILCLFLGLLSASAAVPETASGTIIDGENGQPIVGAVVQALNKQGKATAFASSNADGVFKIKISDSIDSISFRCMGYESLKLSKNHDFAKGVEMWPKATQLKDVIVQAPDIYAKGDTLVFNVSRYANASDNAIIDVIKRLPGIKSRTMEQSSIRGSQSINSILTAMISLEVSMGSPPTISPTRM